MIHHTGHATPQPIVIAGDVLTFTPLPPDLADQVAPCLAHPELDGVYVDLYGLLLGMALGPAAHHVGARPADSLDPFHVGARLADPLDPLCADDIGEAVREVVAASTRRAGVSWVRHTSEV